MPTWEIRKQNRNKTEVLTYYENYLSSFFFIQITLVVFIIKFPHLVYHRPIANSVLKGIWSFYIHCSWIDCSTWSKFNVLHKLINSNIKFICRIFICINNLFTFFKKLKLNWFIFQHENFHVCLVSCICMHTCTHMFFFKINSHFKHGISDLIKV